MRVVDELSPTFDFSHEKTLSSLRVPPHSIEAESTVLGGLLLHNEAWDRVGDLLTEDDFYRHEHRLVYEVIAGLINASKPADVITVYERLQSHGKAVEVGGLAYLNALAQYVPSSGNMRRYAEIVHERSILRKLVSASDEIATLAFNTKGLSAPEIVDHAVQAVQALQLENKSHEPVMIADCMVSFIETLEAKASGKMAVGIKTRFQTIDRMLSGGFKPGKVICIAARPSVGKTAFALQILANIAKNQDAAAFLSQEMLRDELSNRLVANTGRADYGQIEAGSPTSETWERIVEGVEAVREMPLHVDDQAGLTLLDIQRKARKLRSQHEIKVLAIDYLQLCQTTSKHDNRATAIGEISRGIKKLAMQLGITVVILSQLNRDVEKRVGGKPMMADLRESGDIEQDCDTIMMLSEVQEVDAGKIIRCEIVKNRAGKKGEVPLLFQGQYQRFSETVFDLKHPNPKPQRRDF